MKILTQQAGTELQEIAKSEGQHARERVAYDKFKKRFESKLAATEEIEMDANRDLDRARIDLDLAGDALAALKKEHIVEIRSFKTPPPLVQMVLEAVCVLLGDGVLERDHLGNSWEAAKKLLADPHLVTRLTRFKAGSVTASTRQKLHAYMRSKDFQPKIVSAQSRA